MLINLLVESFSLEVYNINAEVRCINMKEKFIYIWKKYHLFYLLLPISIFILKYFMYLLSNYINDDWHTINMKIDKYIPLCKYFIVFYVTYYFFPELQLWRISFNNKRKYYRMLIALCISFIICTICFCIYQVKMIRPEIVGNDIFDNALRLMYKIDKEALNCFPSMHAVMGTLMIIGGTKSSKLSTWLSITSYICGIGCILSTLFIKQHYFIDVVVGISLILIVYAIVTLIDKKIKNK